MNENKLELYSKVLKQMSKDIENDVKEFDGKPFTGTVVAEYLGRQSAAIAVLADIVAGLIKEMKENNK